jgi:hypothetical protein
MYFIYSFREISTLMSLGVKPDVRGPVVLETTVAVFATLNRTLCDL